ncbi:MAG: cysteine--tRNA ligase [Thermoplasmataceae archaeon]
MKFYDSMEKSTVSLDLPADSVVRVFVCGPTVQDNIHIGHGRTYIFFDTMVKYLRSKGLEVFYLQNITDIDDKIINRALELNTSFQDVSETYLRKYLSLMKRLRIDSVNFYARATFHIRHIIDQISRLIDIGLAYETSDGVYFKISGFKEFGKLSGQNTESLLAGARITPAENKLDPRDFVLWKKRKAGEPFWNSPWGDGRPGWHVEDTAITETYFGKTYDIHGGGSDLMFPHHDAEIAIERSLSGEEILARYWIHTGMVNVHDEKMSKSLKNYVLLDDILQKWDPGIVRFWALSALYRSMVNYDDQSLEEARVNVGFIRNVYHRLRSRDSFGAGSGHDFSKLANKIADAIDNDFNFREGFVILRENLQEAWNSFEALSEKETHDLIEVIEWVDSFAGILPDGSDRKKDGLVKIMINLRKDLRKERKYDLSDKIRSSLLELGIHLEDQGDETLWWE